MTADVGVLVEREAEIAALGKIVDAAIGGRGTVLVVEGKAGLGKTALLTRGASLATGRGCLVLEATGSPLGSQFPYAVARQLIEPVLVGATDEQREQLLRGPAKVVGHLVEPVPGAPAFADEFALLLGFYWLLAHLSEAQPVLVVVDDVHLADPASLRIVEFVTSRIDGLPVSIVLAGAGDLYGSPVIPRDADHLILRPLSPTATSTLVEQVALPPALAPAIHEASGGVPSNALALIRHVHREQCLDPSQIRTMAPVEVARRLVAHAREAGPDAWQVLQAVSVLATPASAAVIAASADLAAEATSDCLTALEIRGLVAQQDDGQVAIAQPVLRSAVEETLSPVERAEIHGRVGRALLASGAPVARIAPHAMLTTPGSAGWAVEVLAKSASALFALGEHRQAVEILERASAEAPPEDRLALGFKTGVAQAMYDPTAAATTLKPIVTAATGEAWWPRAVRRLADVFAAAGNPDLAVSGLDAALPNVPTGSVEYSRLLAVRRMYLLAAQRPDDRPDLAAPDPDASDPASRSMHAAARTMELLHANAPAAEIRSLALTAWDYGAFLDLEPPNSPLTWSLLHALISCGEDTVADRGIDLVLTTSTTFGLTSGIGLGLQLRAALRINQSNLAAAGADAAQSKELLDQAVPFAAPLSAALLIRAQLEAGDVAQANEIATRWTDQLGRPQGTPAEGLWVMASMAAVAARRVARADQLLADLPHSRSFGIDSAAMIPRGPADVLVAEALGNRDLAVENARRLHDAANSFGMANPIAEALVLRARVDSDPEGLLREAMEISDAWSLPAARAGLALGHLLQSDDTIQAKRLYGRSLEVASALGAAPLATAAAAGLRSLGDRTVRYTRPGPIGLTPGEKRVAGLARDGLSNREIAERLFVTVKAVEAHLSNVYRKLGIRSRTDLEHVLGQDHPAEI